MKVKLREIDPILDIPAICDLLKVSEAQFHRKKALLERYGLLKEVLPVIDCRPRFQGGPFVELLSDRRQQQLIDEQLRALEKAS